MANVKVAVRVRPPCKREEDAKATVIVNDFQDNVLGVTNLKLENSESGNHHKERIKHFSFDYCYFSLDKNAPNYASQELIFGDLGRQLLDASFDGYNACLFAYGQTGSGKTYTMMGDETEKGLIPRICENLLDRISNYEEDVTFKVEVSFLEIYNERVRDLLAPPSRAKYTLRVREHPKDGPYVQDLSHHLVSDYEQVLSLMNAGNLQRTTAATHMHELSSRSHAIFTITFIQAKMAHGMPSEIVSKINLVDLAGSERASINTSKDRLQEGANINKSLVTLGNCIQALGPSVDKSLYVPETYVSTRYRKAADSALATASMESLSVSEADWDNLTSPRRRTNFVPYRNSILTWLLKDSLGGNSKTIMIATISPASIHYNETMSTLRYARRAKHIVNQPIINEDRNVRLIRELREEINRLKMLLNSASLASSQASLIQDQNICRMLQENEQRVDQLTEAWVEKWRDAARIMQECNVGIRKESVGVIVESELPHLIGMDDDLLSTGIILYHLKEGKTKIGREDAPERQDIVLYGPDMEMEHALITNQNGRVILTPLGDSMCAVNGLDVTRPVELSQGAVIMLGRTNMFRFNHPAEAARLRERRASIQPPGPLRRSRRNSVTLRLPNTDGALSADFSKRFSLAMSLDGSWSAESELRTSPLRSSFSDLSSEISPIMMFNPGLELERRHKLEAEKLEDTRKQLAELEAKKLKAEAAQLEQETRMQESLHHHQERIREQKELIDRLKVDHQEAMEKAREDLLLMQRKADSEKETGKQQLLDELTQLQELLSSHSEMCTLPSVVADCNMDADDLSSLDIARKRVAMMELMQRQAQRKALAALERRQATLEVQQRTAQLILKHEEQKLQDIETDSCLLENDLAAGQSPEKELRKSSTENGVCGSAENIGMQLSASGRVSPVGNSDPETMHHSQNSSPKNKSSPPEVYGVAKKDCNGSCKESSGSVRKTAHSKPSKRNDVGSVRTKSRLEQTRKESSNRTPTTRSPSPCKTSRSSSPLKSSRSSSPIKSSRSSSPMKSSRSSSPASSTSGMVGNKRASGDVFSRLYPQQEAKFEFLRKRSPPRYSEHDPHRERQRDAPCFIRKERSPIRDDPIRLKDRTRDSDHLEKESRTRVPLSNLPDRAKQNLHSRSRSASPSVNKPIKPVSRPKKFPALKSPSDNEKPQIKTNESSKAPIRSTHARSQSEPSKSPGKHQRASGDQSTPIKPQDKNIPKHTSLSKKPSRTLNAGTAKSKLYSVPNASPTRTNPNVSKTASPRKISEHTSRSPSPRKGQEHARSHRKTVKRPLSAAQKTPNGDCNGSPGPRRKFQRTPVVKPKNWPSLENLPKSTPRSEAFFVPLTSQQLRDELQKRPVEGNTSPFHILGDEMGQRMDCQDSHHMTGKKISTGNKTEQSQALPGINVDVQTLQTGCLFPQTTDNDYISSDNLSDSLEESPKFHRNHDAEAYTDHIQGPRVVDMASADEDEFWAIPVSSEDIISASSDEDVDNDIEAVKNLDLAERRQSCDSTDNIFPNRNAYQQSEPRHRKAEPHSGESEVEDLDVNCSSDGHETYECNNSNVSREGGTSPATSNHERNSSSADELTTDSGSLPAMLDSCPATGGQVKDSSNPEQDCEVLSALDGNLAAEAVETNSDHPKCACPREESETDLEDNISSPDGEGVACHDEDQRSANQASFMPDSSECNLSSVDNPLCDVKDESENQTDCTSLYRTVLHTDNAELEQDTGKDKDVLEENNNKDSPKEELVKNKCIAPGTDTRDIAHAGETEGNRDSEEESLPQEALCLDVSNNPICQTGNENEGTASEILAEDAGTEGRQNTEEDGHVREYGNANIPDSDEEVLDHAQAGSHELSPEDAPADEPLVETHTGCDSVDTTDDLHVANFGNKELAEGTSKPDGKPCEEQTVEWKPSECGSPIGHRIFPEATGLGAGVAISSTPNECESPTPEKDEEQDEGYIGKQLADTSDVTPFTEGTNPDGTDREGEKFPLNMGQLPDTAFDAQLETLPCHDNLPLSTSELHHLPNLDQIPTYVARTEQYTTSLEQSPSMDDTARTANEDVVVKPEDDFTDSCKQSAGVTDGENDPGQEPDSTSSHPTEKQDLTEQLPSPSDTHSDESEDTDAEQSACNEHHSLHQDILDLQVCNEHGRLSHQHEPQQETNVQESPFQADENHAEHLTGNKECSAADVSSSQNNSPEKRQLSANITALNVDLAEITDTNTPEKLSQDSATSDNEDTLESEISITKCSMPKTKHDICVETDIPHADDKDMLQSEDSFPECPMPEKEHDVCVETDIPHADETDMLLSEVAVAECPVPEKERDIILETDIPHANENEMLEREVPVAKCPVPEKEHDIWVETDVPHAAENSMLESEELVTECPVPEKEHDVSVGTDIPQADEKDMLRSEDSLPDGPVPEKERDVGVKTDLPHADEKDMLQSEYSFAEGPVPEKEHDNCVKTDVLHADVKTGVPCADGNDMRESEDSFAEGPVPEKEHDVCVKTDLPHADKKDMLESKVAVAECPVPEKEHDISDETNIPHADQKDKLESEELVTEYPVPEKERDVCVKTDLPHADEKDMRQNEDSVTECQVPEKEHDVCVGADIPHVHSASPVVNGTENVSASTHLSQSHPVGSSLPNESDQCDQETAASLNREQLVLATSDECTDDNASHAQSKQVTVSRASPVAFSDDEEVSADTSSCSSSSAEQDFFNEEETLSDFLEDVKDFEDHDSAVSDDGPEYQPHEISGKAVMRMSDTDQSSEAETAPDKDVLNMEAMTSLSGSKESPLTLLPAPLFENEFVEKPLFAYQHSPSQISACRDSLPDSSGMFHSAMESSLYQTAIESPVDSSGTEKGNFPLGPWKKDQLLASSTPTGTPVSTPVREPDLNERQSWKHTGSPSSAHIESEDIAQNSESSSMSDRDVNEMISFKPTGHLSDQCPADMKDMKGEFIKEVDSTDVLPLANNFHSRFTSPNGYLPQHEPSTLDNHEYSYEEEEAAETSEAPYSSMHLPVDQTYTPHSLPPIQEEEDTPTETSDSAETCSTLHTLSPQNSRNSSPASEMSGDSEEGPIVTGNESNAIKSLSSTLPQSCKKLEESPTCSNDESKPKSNSVKLDGKSVNSMIHTTAPASEITTDADINPTTEAGTIEKDPPDSPKKCTSMKKNDVFSRLYPQSTPKFSFKKKSAVSVIPKDTPIPSVSPRLNRKQLIDSNQNMDPLKSKDSASERAEDSSNGFDSSDPCFHPSQDMESVDLSNPENVLNEVKEITSERGDLRPGVTYEKNQQTSATPEYCDHALNGIGDMHINHMGKFVDAPQSDAVENLRPFLGKEYAMASAKLTMFMRMFGLSVESSDSSDGSDSPVLGMGSSERGLVNSIVGDGVGYNREALKRDLIQSPESEPEECGNMHSPSWMGSDAAVDGDSSIRELRSRSTTFSDVEPINTGDELGLDSADDVSILLETEGSNSAEIDRDIVKAEDKFDVSKMANVHTEPSISCTMQVVDRCEDIFRATMNINGCEMPDIPAASKMDSAEPSQVSLYTYSSDDGAKITPQKAYSLPSGAEENTPTFAPCNVKPATEQRESEENEAVLIQDAYEQKLPQFRSNLSDVVLVKENVNVINNSSRNIPLPNLPLILQQIHEGESTNEISEHVLSSEGEQGDERQAQISNNRNQVIHAATDDKLQVPESENSTNDETDEHYSGSSVKLSEVPEEASKELLSQDMNKANNEGIPDLKPSSEVITASKVLLPEYTLPSFLYERPAGEHLHDKAQTVPVTLAGNSSLLISIDASDEQALTVPVWQKEKSKVMFIKSSDESLSLKNVVSEDIHSDMMVVDDVVLPAVMQTLQSGHDNVLSPKASSNAEVEEREDSVDKSTVVEEVTEELCESLPKKESCHIDENLPSTSGDHPQISFKKDINAPQSKEDNGKQAIREDLPNHSRVLEKSTTPTLQLSHPDETVEAPSRSLIESGSVDGRLPDSFTMPDFSSEPQDSAPQFHQVAVDVNENGCLTDEVANDDRPGAPVPQLVCSEEKAPSFISEEPETDTSVSKISLLPMELDIGQQTNPVPTSEPVVSELILNTPVILPDNITLVRLRGLMDTDSKMHLQADVQSIETVSEEGSNSSSEESRKNWKHRPDEKISTIEGTPSHMFDMNADEECPRGSPIAHEKDVSNPEKQTMLCDENLADSVERDHHVQLPCAVVSEVYVQNLATLPEYKLHMAKQGTPTQSIQDVKNDGSGDCKEGAMETDPTSLSETSGKPESAPGDICGHSPAENTPDSELPTIHGAENPSHGHETFFSSNALDDISDTSMHQDEVSSDDVSNVLDEICTKHSVTLPEFTWPTNFSPNTPAKGAQNSSEPPSISNDEEMKSKPASTPMCHYEKRPSANATTSSTEQTVPPDCVHKMLYDDVFSNGAKDDIRDAPPPGGMQEMFHDEEGHSDGARVNKKDYPPPKVHCTSPGNIANNCTPESEERINDETQGMFKELLDDVENRVSGDCRMDTKSTHSPKTPRQLDGEPTDDHISSGDFNSSDMDFVSKPPLNQEKEQSYHGDPEKAARTSEESQGVSSNRPPFISEICTKHPVTLAEYTMPTRFQHNVSDVSAGNSDGLPTIMKDKEEMTSQPSSSSGNQHEGISLSNVMTPSTADEDANTNSAREDHGRVTPDLLHSRVNQTCTPHVVDQIDGHAKEEYNEAQCNPDLSVTPQMHVSCFEEHMSSNYRADDVVTRISSDESASQNPSIQQNIDEGEPGSQHIFKNLEPVLVKVAQHLPDEPVQWHLLQSLDDLSDSPKVQQSASPVSDNTTQCTDTECIPRRETDVCKIEVPEDSPISPNVLLTDDMHSFKPITPSPRLMMSAEQLEKDVKDRVDDTSTKRVIETLEEARFPQATSCGVEDEVQLEQLGSECTPSDRQKDTESQQLSSSLLAPHQELGNVHSPAVSPFLSSRSTDDELIQIFAAAKHTGFQSLYVTVGTNTSPGLNGSHISIADASTFTDDGCNVLSDNSEPNLEQLFSVSVQTSPFEGVNLQDTSTSPTNFTSGHLEVANEKGAQTVSPGDEPDHGMGIDASVSVDTIHITAQHSEKDIVSDSQSVGTSPLPEIESVSTISPTLASSPIKIQDSLAGGSRSAKSQLEEISLAHDQECQTSVFSSSPSSPSPSSSIADVGDISWRRGSEVLQELTEEMDSQELELFAVLMHKRRLSEQTVERVKDLAAKLRRSNRDDELNLLGSDLNPELDVPLVQSDGETIIEESSVTINTAADENEKAEDEHSCHDFPRIQSPDQMDSSTSSEVREAVNSISEQLTEDITSDLCDASVQENKLKPEHLETTSNTEVYSHNLYERTDDVAAGNDEFLELPSHKGKVSPPGVSAAQETPSEFSIPSPSSDSKIDGKPVVPDQRRSHYVTSVAPKATENATAKSRSSSQNDWHAMPLQSSWDEALFENRNNNNSADLDENSYVSNHEENTSARPVDSILLPDEASVKKALKRTLSSFSDVSVDSNLDFPAGVDTNSKESYTEEEDEEEEELSKDALGESFDSDLFGDSIEPELLALQTDTDYNLAGTGPMLSNSPTGKPGTVGPEHTNSIKQLPGKSKQPEIKREYVDTPEQEEDEDVNEVDSLRVHVPSLSPAKLEWLLAESESETEVSYLPLSEHPENDKIPLPGYSPVLPKNPLVMKKHTEEILPHQINEKVSARDLSLNMYPVKFSLPDESHTTPVLYQPMELPAGSGNNNMERTGSSLGESSGVFSLASEMPNQRQEKTPIGSMDSLINATSTDEERDLDQLRAEYEKLLQKRKSNIKSERMAQKDSTITSDTHLENLSDTESKVSLPDSHGMMNGYKSPNSTSSSELDGFVHGYYSKSWDRRDTSVEILEAQVMHGIGETDALLNYLDDDLPLEYWNSQKKSFNDQRCSEQPVERTEASASRITDPTTPPKPSRKSPRASMRKSSTSPSSLTTPSQTTPPPVQRVVTPPSYTLYPPKSPSEPTASTERYRPSEHLKFLKRVRENVVKATAHSPSSASPSPASSPYPSPLSTHTDIGGPLTSAFNMEREEILFLLKELRETRRLSQSEIAKAEVDLLPSRRCYSAGDTSMQDRDAFNNRPGGEDSKDQLTSNNELRADPDVTAPNTSRPEEELINREIASLRAAASVIKPSVLPSPSNPESEFEEDREENPFESGGSPSKPAYYQLYGNPTRLSSSTSKEPYKPPKSRYGYTLYDDVTSPMTKTFPPASSSVSSRAPPPTTSTPLHSSGGVQLQQYTPLRSTGLSTSLPVPPSQRKPLLPSGVYLSASRHKSTSAALPGARTPPGYRGAPGSQVKMSPLKSNIRHRRHQSGKTFQELPTVKESKLVWSRPECQLVAEKAIQTLVSEMAHFNSFDPSINQQPEEEGGWRYEGRDRDILLLSKWHGTSHPINSYTGIGIIKAPARTVYNYLKDPTNRQLYDPMLKEVKIKKDFGDGLQVVYMVFKTDQCLLQHPRDCLLVIQTREMDDRFLLVASSIHHSRIPVRKKIVRAEVLMAGFCIQALMSGGTEHCRVTHLTRLDLHGDLHPKLINTLTSRQPLSIADLRSFIEI
ncbi:uncharacterized protein [Diadema antillarum]|uniref:uncharacterized protein n=1 Tax=Diadema antillarum TaxID=105358 RepID=UPI003A88771B